MYPDWFINELAEEETRDLARLGKLHGKSKAKFVCEFHGIYEQTIYDHINLQAGTRKSGCPVCGKGKLTRNKFPDWFIEELENESDKERARKLSLKARDRVQMRCTKHGVYEDTVGHLVKRATGERIRGCPICAKGIPDWVMAETNESLIGRDSREKIEFVCPVHGPYKQRLGDHIRIKSGDRVSGCPKCVSGGHQSSLEREIGAYLDEWGVTFESNARGYITSNGRNYEVDIMVPDKRIGIELNGSYWHASLGNSESTRKDPLYHHNKARAAEENGVRLIQIFDVDWMYRREEILRFLENVFKPSTAFYARKLRVARVDNKVAGEFNKSNHVQGHSRFATINYGLYDGEELIACMGFGTQRYQNSDRLYELHRYCVKKRCTVSGGAHRLFKTFISKHDFDEIVSYSDMDLFTGGVYPSLGFEFDGYTNPRYYWVNARYDLKSREECMLKNLVKTYPDINLDSIIGNKEDAIMVQKGYFKVYRAGNKRWIYRKG